MRGRVESVQRLLAFEAYRGGVTGNRRHSSSPVARHDLLPRSLIKPDSDMESTAIRTLSAERIGKKIGQASAEQLADVVEGEMA
jgi:mRNA-degrading endonuclease toxin of MazEF toxin-antitoxin module